jgi:hypothetical protein
LKYKVFVVPACPVHYNYVYMKHKKPNWSFTVMGASWLCLFRNISN